jgi:hypothetical protein
MIKTIKIQLFIILGILSLSIFVYKGLQNPTIYEYTLSEISHNYNRIGDFHSSQVIETQQPYQKITKNNMYQWDAQLYKIIADSSYSGSKERIQVRLAFYPLYPFLWKLTRIDSPLIFILNYALFALGLIILFNLFLENKKDNYFIFGIALILPAAIVYYLPYAESLFLLTFVLAIAALFKQKYWLFFIAAMAFSMTRPAALIFLFVLIVADFRYFFIHRQFRSFIKELSLKILPFIIGILAVTVIQHLYSDSWTAYFDALFLWSVESGFLNPITDWSIEGFGMSTFSLFFIGIPSFIYSIIWGIKAFKKNNSRKFSSLFSGNTIWIKEYLFNASVIFIAGTLLYTALTTNNSLNGFYRYTMDVPFSFIILFLLPEKIKNKSILSKIIVFTLCLFGLTLFLYFVKYGGSDRFQFSYLGLYLSIFMGIFVLILPYLSFSKKLILFLLLLVPSIIWHTYLFNMYLCNGWIYT